MEPGYLSADQARIRDLPVVCLSSVIHGIADHDQLGPEQERQLSTLKKRHLNGPSPISFAVEISNNCAFSMFSSH